MHDPGDVTDPDEPPSRAGVDSGAEAPISDADAADEVAQAEARAEAARARLVRLRRATETTDDDAVPDEVEQHPGRLSGWRRRLLRRPARPRWLRRPTRKAVAIGVGIVLTSASLGASGYMVWQHYTAVHKRQLAAEFTTAARQDVTMLMSLDAQHAKEDLQRVIDACTGDFKQQLEATSSLIVEKAGESKASSKATVEAVGVESMSANSAVVLVAVKSDVSNADNTSRPPAVWRISVGITRDGGQLKMSNVNFLQ